MRLSSEEKAILAGEIGSDGSRSALRIVVEAARMMGAGHLIPIQSSHIDGCLYHGASGTLFCERLVQNGAHVSVPATTNVGALNLLKPAQSRLSGEARQMAFRLMVAHEKMGCRPSWTCAPYQAGARPAQGTDVAWGESNAVAFINSVLGARSNRYGDFLDISCAITGRAPYFGLHVQANRVATLEIDISELPGRWQTEDLFYPVLGALTGRLAGSSVPVLTGMACEPTEDQLKALCAGAAATGAVGLLHIAGVTPEAPNLESVSPQNALLERICVDVSMMRETFESLSAVSLGAKIDSVAMGSPHMSAEECREVLRLANGQRFDVPVYLCLGRHTLAKLKRTGEDLALEALGAELVVDTCVVVTPILSEAGGVMMTNSAKFAHYAKGNTGHDPVLASTGSCVRSAQVGNVISANEFSL